MAVELCYVNCVVTLLFGYSSLCQSISKLKWLVLIIITACEHMVHVCEHNLYCHIGIHLGRIQSAIARVRKETLEDSWVYKAIRGVLVVQHYPVTRCSDDWLFWVTMRGYCWFQYIVVSLFWMFWHWMKKMIVTVAS